MASQSTHQSNEVNGVGISGQAAGAHSNGSSVDTGKQLKHYEAPPVNGKPVRADRQGVTDAFAQFGQLLHASLRPLPTENGDGTYTEPKVQTGLLQDLGHLRLRDIKTLLDVARSKAKGEQVVDDKTMIMERVIQLVAKLPPTSHNRVLLTNDFLSELWYTLDHPPMLRVGEQFQYRMADGSYNNILYPQLGAAGSTYARSVQPTVVLPAALPDPELIFDSVMARSEFKKHPNNVSSVLWYWATIIIHDLFWTDYPETSKSKTSSYLDLSPLYGSNQAMQDSVRTFKDGKLKPDAFADKRLLGMPPGVCVLLVMFNRFHNYIAENLATINEGGRFSKPEPNSDEQKLAAAWKKYDNDLFQTARLITSGLYINITLLDYVRNIINLNRCDTTWTLDPRVEMGIDSGTPKGAERGTGNAVSAEFNLCYRWHSCISAKDEKWIQEFYGGVFKKPATEITTRDMVCGFAKFEKETPADPAERHFGGFKRGADGKFNDDELVACISDAVEDCAGAFGARNVPQAMKPVEVLGILQGRKWNVAGLNEFRKHFGLKPYERFEDINSDPVVADQLRHLYEHPDFVELYPGIVAEEAKTPMVPGVGIAPTYTISRVILSDAVCLVRGDRYYTTDYTPRNLTNWGYQEVHYDLGVNQGCSLYKLFMRAFPNHFRYNSIYAHYPMVIPSENRKIMANLGREASFDYSRPSFKPPPIPVTSYGAARKILEDQGKYKVTWHEGLTFLVGEAGNRFELSGDTPFHASRRQCMSSILYGEEWHAHIKAFYAQITEQLLEEKSYRLAGKKHVDIVRDVGNVAHTHFAARVFGLPLKTGENPRGIYSEQELYTVLAVAFITVFLDLDPAKSFALRQAARTVVGQLAELVEANVKTTTGFGLRALFFGPDKKNDPLAMYGANLIKGLAKAGLSSSDIVKSQIMPTATGSVPNQAEAFAQAVDFYLSPSRSAHLAELHRLACQPSSAETDALLLGYAMEGIRLAGTFGVLRDVAAAGTIDDNGREVPVKAGDRILVSFVAASRDPKHFPDPEAVNPRRPLEAYLHYGAGPHACLGRAVSQTALTEMFRALFRRKNVHRAKGPQGELKKVPQPGGFVAYMSQDWGSVFPFPTTMKISWDDE